VVRLAVAVIAPLAVLVTADDQPMDPIISSWTGVLSFACTILIAVIGFMIRRDITRFETEQKEIKKDVLAAFKAIDALRSQHLQLDKDCAVKLGRIDIESKLNKIEALVRHGQ
jgi:hypothetical protein